MTDPFVLWTVRITLFGLFLIFLVHFGHFVWSEIWPIAGPIIGQFFYK